ncbi:hypothetical protein MTR67_005636 [Solanum verrucosum]|uniref:HhH-GPD domain-containing protein n=1 Tax=Solanum verrucosum TaxID=315347 RepID=A0AAF0Q194_SOLVR|nr:hypothetical protein MTR67_005636 [Solanum verrucosum]
MQHRQEIDRHRSVVVELPLEDGDGDCATFDLEKAVCSHGLFMMAPNRWDSLSKTLERPLRLSENINDDDHEQSVLVQITQPSDSPHSLLLRVFGTDSLSTIQQRSLLGQVRRMVRLSVEENKRVKQFQEICGEANERGFGRVFRSPTLFEDMVKCMLLCNCQWSRTLSMVEALCELQLELNCPSLAASFPDPDNQNQLKGITFKSEHFTPRTPATPAGKESRKRAGAYGCSRKLLERLTEVEEIIDIGKPGVTVTPAFSVGEEVLKKSNLCRDTTEVCDVGTSAPFNPDPSEDRKLSSFNQLGNFPSPKELASLDESFLAKRCGLGYRAGRIIKLAKGIVEGSIQLKELEEACSNPSLANYDKMAEQLREIDGFGRFTCANVLMCLGYYHVIPTDSETIRHLKQVHARTSTIQNVQRDVENIYGKYAPFQFLAYWLEVWHFYEERFGKLSEMPHSEYKLITAANMRRKRKGKCKKLKITSTEKLGV